jgi:D-amino-acid oxidase
MYDAVIVGAGVIGLSCALRLQESGRRVAVVSPEGPETTTSWVAAAVWYPSHTDADPRVLDWARRTFVELSDQAVHQVPGVTMRPTRMLLRGSTLTPWWAVAVPDFRIAHGRDLPPVYTGEWHFSVPAVEMGVYLNWQIQRVTSAGGVLLRRRLDHLADVADLAPVIINASGLAARELADDPSVYPARGRLVLTTNPGLDTSVRDEDAPAGVTYIHPRSRDVVLGGTFEPHESDLSPDADESQAIIERCTALVPELEKARVLGMAAGLRPARENGVRLEVDADTGVIHNYGHGGAGVTLSWGCADAVTALLPPGRPRSSGWGR